MSWRRKFKFGREFSTPEPDFLYDEVHEAEGYVRRMIDQTGYVDALFDTPDSPGIGDPSRTKRERKKRL